MLWVLSALGWLRKAAQGLFSLAGRYPLQAALIALLCLAGWLWHGKGRAIEDRDLARAETAKVISAGKEAHDRQLAINAAAEKRYADDAERIETDARENLETGMAAAERHIAAGRVRCPATGGPRGSAGAAAPDRGSANPAGASGAAFVDAIAVPADDVLICTENTIKAEAGHTLASSLTE